MPASTADEQEDRRIHDEWETAIQDFTALYTEITVNAIAAECLKLPLSMVDVSIQDRIAGCLGALGWISVTDRSGGGAVRRVYKRREE